MTSFREIESDDMDAIFDVRVATWHNERGRDELTGMGITPESVRAMIADSHKGWLCEIDARPVGFAMGNRDTGEMWVITVLEAFEDRGIGRALLTRVEDWLGEEGWDQIWLTTDTDESLRAVGFYRHLGWSDWKIEEGDRFMRKQLG